MAERLPLQPPIFNDMWLSVPQGNDRIEDTIRLAREFAPKRVEEFGESLRRSLETTGDGVALNPDAFQRGGEIFRLEDKEQNVVAIAMSKYYSWNLFKGQLSFQTHKSDKNKIEALSIDTFEGIVEKHFGQNDYSIAVELAYNLIDTQYRRIGLGSKMFSLRLARASVIKTDKPKLVFTMSRGAYLADKSGGKILAYLIEKEREANGSYSDGKAIITGLKTYVDEIYSSVNLPNEFIFGQVHADSYPIVGLAAKANMVQVGLFKDLSPVFVTTID